MGHKLWQKANLDHFCSQPSIKRQVEQQPDGDVEEVTVVCGHQTTHLLHNVEVSLSWKDGYNSMVCIQIYI